LKTRLAQDLIAEREENLRRKTERCKDYDRALSIQVKNKLEPITDTLSPPTTEPYFGRNDTNDAKIAENRRRAHELYREQLQTVQQSKRDAILKRLEDQRRDQSALIHARSDLVSDNARRYEHILETRKNLENNWTQAAEYKRAKEAEERAWKKNACQSLFHEQCNRYQRCRQCKRKISNTGKTNLLPNTRMMA